MTGYGHINDDKALCFTRVLPGPIERVWAFITEEDKRAKWLAAGKTGAAAGETIEFRFNHDDLTPHKEEAPEGSCGDEGTAFDGTVKAFDPPHHLAFTWPERNGGETYVDIRLSEMEDGRVQLDLKHSGILTRSDLLGASGGWHTHLDILEAHLAEQIPAPFWSTHQAKEMEYGTRFTGQLSGFED